MADIGVGNVGNIVQIGLLIKDAVETVQQNKEDCDKIKKLAIQASSIVQQLQERKLQINNSNVSSALEELELTLRNALTLVTACQERHIVCLFCKAWGLSKQLHRVREDIFGHMMMGNFAMNATFLLVGAEHPAPLEPPQEAAVASQVSGNSHVIDVSSNGGFGNDGNENSAAAGSDMNLPSIPGLKRFSYSELKEATQGFSSEWVLGRGGFGEVYKGKLHDGKVVAIKNVYMPIMHSTKHIVDELILNSRLQHKNIVRLLGYAFDVQKTIKELNGKCVVEDVQRLLLVHEFMPHGSLANHMGGDVDWRTRFNIIQGIAEGIQYLHENMVIHSDLKPDNILMDSDMTPKISDFGLSTMFKEGMENSRIFTINIGGTLGYIPPEYLDRGIVSFKNDIFAFGVLLLDIVSGRGRGASVGWAWNVREAGRLKAEFNSSLLDESQLKEIERCVTIGLLCSQANSEHRPIMADVLKMIHGNKKLPNPKKPSYI